MYEHLVTSDINERVKLWTTILLLNMLTFSFTHIQCIIYFHGSVLFFDCTSISLFHLKILF
jgi:hypothetical protein